jgi:hypothetical protein
VTQPGPANPVTIRAAVIAAIKDAGYLHVPAFCPMAVDVVIYDCSHTA